MLVALNLSKHSVKRSNYYLYFNYLGNNGMTEYVRQELRAMVGARTSQSSGPPRPPSQQIQVAPGQLVPPADFEALGLTFEMPSSGNYTFENYAFQLNV